MRPPDYAKAHIVAAAALGALTEARRQSRDLLSRRCADAAPDLLRGHAAEMARSPLGRDQVLSLALLVAADDLECRRSPAATSELVLLEPEPDEAARLDVRTRVLDSGLVPTAEARLAAEDLERRHRPECGSDLDLSARLTAEANLHETLWDDPRLPADDRTRLTMLFSVPQLLERAEALGAGRQPRSRARRAGSQAAQRLPWRLRSVSGLPLAGWLLVFGPTLVSTARGGMSLG